MVRMNPVARNGAVGKLTAGTYIASRVITSRDATSLGFVGHGCRASRRGKLLIRTKLKSVEDGDLNEAELPRRAACTMEEC